MAILFLLKTGLTVTFRKIDLPYILGSFFKLYKKGDVKSTNNLWRKRYMILNNPINYYTYLWLLLCALNILVFGDLI